MALVKIRAAGRRYGELLDVVQLYHATVVDESADSIILEITGSEAFVLSCIRALERFEILEIARSGAVAMEAVGLSTFDLNREQPMSDRLNIYYDSDADPQPAQAGARSRSSATAARATPMPST